MWVTPQVNTPKENRMKKNERTIRTQKMDYVKCNCKIKQRIGFFLVYGLLALRYKMSILKRLFCHEIRASVFQTNSHTLSNTRTSVPHIFKME